MFQKRGAVSHADLVKHAIDMRYGVGVRSVRTADEVNSIRIEIIEAR